MDVLTLRYCKRVQLFQLCVLPLECVFHLNLSPGQLHQVSIGGGAAVLFMKCWQSPPGVFTCVGCVKRAITVPKRPSGKKKACSSIHGRRVLVPLSVSVQDISAICHTGLAFRLCDQIWSWTGRTGSFCYRRTKEFPAHFFIYIYLPLVHFPGALRKAKAGVCTLHRQHISPPVICAVSQGQWVDVGLEGTLRRAENTQPSETKASLMSSHQGYSYKRFIHSRRTLPILSFLASLIIVFSSYLNV